MGNVEKDVEDLVFLIQNDLGYSEAEESFVRSQLFNLDKNREAVFVVEIDDSVVGFIHVEKYSNIYFGPVGNILGLAVRENFRNKVLENSFYRLQKTGQKKKDV